MTTQSCPIRTKRDKKEIQAHGSAEFPSAIYYSERGSGSCDAVRWHWHEEFEVLYIVKGKCRLQVPGEEHILSSGEMAFVNSNTLHYAIGEPFFVLESFVFSPLLLTGSTDSIFHRKYVRPLMESSFKVWITGKDEDRDHFRKAYVAQREESFAYEFTVRENLSSLLLSLYREKEKALNLASRPKDTDSIRIGRMLDYIHSHYRENITLDDIASSSALSAREALRCFRRTISDTPIQYLLKYRLMQSASLLLGDPSLSVSEITTLCGFDYPCYYSRQFKRFYHYAPKEYRQLYGKHALPLHPDEHI